MSNPRTSRSSYAQTLRVIGQSLDPQRAAEFDLQLIDGEFVVRLREQEIPPSSWKKLSRSMGIASGFGKGERKLVEHHYSMEKIDELDQTAQTKRAGLEATPDFYLLSQTLRTVGDYIDHSSLRLSALSRRGPRLILWLEEPNGRNRVEEHVLPSFHNYFLQMYLKRKKEALPR